MDADAGGRDEQNRKGVLPDDTSDFLFIENNPMQSSR
jgi:hypothetical protein